MSERIIAQYKKFIRRRVWFMSVTVFLLFIVAMLALVSGSASTTIPGLFKTIAGQADPFTSQIILSIRLPRVVGAVLAGTALAVSGAVIQSLLKNPLASPFTLGISGAAAFGAAFAIIFLGAGSGYSAPSDAAIIDNPYVVTVSAFIWSLVSVVVILFLSKYKGATPEVIILSGIIISSLFGAGISAMQYFSNDVQLAAIVFWTFGDMGRATWRETIIMSAILVPVMAFFLHQSWNYKSLQSGDEYARSLGVNVTRVRLTGMVAASLATAVVVSFFGVIAFVGLVVPHIVRRIIGSDEHFVIPASALFGGAFLLLSDTLARTAMSPVIMPVGILTSFIGAPLFLFLLIRGMKR